MNHAIAFSAPHAHAADIGLAILREGGNAVDAMIAAAAAITVLYPHMNSLAGDGFWLIQAPGAAPVAIDACGCAAGLASINWYRDQGFSQIPSRGALATLNMGGTLAGWQKARELTATEALLPPMPLSHLLAPAIALARGGIRVTHSLAAASRKVQTELAGEAEYQRVFMPNGRPLEEGEALINRDLANTLTLLVTQGLESAYTGELAEHIVRELERCGSPLRLADLQNYQAQTVEPLSVQTRFGRCYNLPAPTQGVASLLILAIYDRLFKPEWDETERVHGLIEATKLAFLVRDREVADPRRLGEGWANLLSTAHIDRLAGLVSPSALPWPQVAEPGDTVWMGCVDSRGTMVSFIQSIYWEFGSGVVVPGTGLVWNNRGVGFSLDANHRNALAPGYKPFHTLNPALAVLDDGRRISYGTMGGEGQPQTQAALLTRYLYDGFSLDEAISRGRWLLGRTWGDNNHDLKMEQDLFDLLGKNLRARAHAIKTVPKHSEIMGHAGAVVSFSDGKALAASDPRSDGAGVVAVAEGSAQ